ncbi:hypothetical protein ACHAXT_005092 [Thalassiosira profunda]
MCRPDVGGLAAVEVGGGGGAPRRPHILRRRLALALALATIAASLSLLFGHAIYPSSPLLASPALAATNGTYASSGGERQQQQRWKLSVATAAFAAATTLRLTAAAPLVRLRDKLPPVGALSSAIERTNAMAGNLERFSHEAWEDAATRANVWGDGDSSYREPPELDLEMAVPCEKGAARTYLMSNGDNPHGNSSEEGTPSCKLRDVITRELLVEYFQRFHDEEFDLATHPVLLRNVWPPESFDEDNKSGSTGGSRRRLTPDAILSDPRLAKLVLPNYFSDATKSGYDALVPDEDAITLSQFLRGIQSRATPHAKIGTQVIVEQYPELRDEIVPTRLARELFGWSTLVDDWKGYLMRRMGRFGGWLQRLPFHSLLDRATRMSYYPIFIAGTHGDASAAHPRTDLHAEPIGNVASQLHGTRHWTLVPAKWSGLLRPTASRHRGFFYSDMGPRTELPERLDRLPRVYRCVTRRGDAVWIPPWMWHRVDYLAPAPDAMAATPGREQQSLSIGASIFHFYPRQYIANFPLFALLIVPNLIMEVLGFNVE